MNYPPILLSFLMDFVVVEEKLFCGLDICWHFPGWGYCFSFVLCARMSSKFIHIVVGMDLCWGIIFSVCDWAAREWTRDTPRATARIITTPVSGAFVCLHSFDRHTPSY